MNRSMLRELAAHMGESDPKGKKKPPMSLAEGYKLFAKRHSFKPGDVVRLKKGMKITARPNYREEVVIVEVLKEPVYSLDNDGTVYWRRPLDIRYGFWDHEGDFVCLYGESQRFEPAK